MLIFCFLFFLQQGTRGNFFDLMSPEYRRTSLQMWLMWFVTAFSYYGMVLASAEILQIHNSGENSKGRSPLAIYLPWTLNEHLSSTYALCTRYMPKTTVLLQLSSHYIVLIFTLYYFVWIWILQMLKAVNVICWNLMIILLCCYLLLESL